MKTLTVKLMAVISTTLLGACMSTMALGNGDSWKEEVLLHDGQKMIVERSQTYGGRSEPGQSGPIKEHTIRLTLPDTQKPITWTSEYSDDIGRTNFILRAIHRLNGIPYIVASPNLCLSYNKWGRPNPPYVIFKHDGSTWQRIPLVQLPIDFKTVNVVQSIQQFQANQMSGMGLVSAEKVKELNRDTERAEAKAILREAFPTERIAQMCGDLILYKGAWIMPNDPVARKMIDQNSK